MYHLIHVSFKVYVIAEFDSEYHYSLLLVYVFIIKYELSFQNENIASVEDKQNISPRANASNTVNDDLVEDEIVKVCKY